MKGLDEESHYEKSLGRVEGRYHEFNCAFLTQRPSLHAGIFRNEVERLI